MFVTCSARAEDSWQHSRAGSLCNACDFFPDSIPVLSVQVEEQGQAPYPAVSLNSGGLHGLVKAIHNAEYQIKQRENVTNARQNDTPKWVLFKNIAFGHAFC